MKQKNGLPETKRGGNPWKPQCCTCFNWKAFPYRKIH